MKIEDTSHLPPVARSCLHSYEVCSSRRCHVTFGVGSTCAWSYHLGIASCSFLLRKGNRPHTLVQAAGSALEAVDAVMEGSYTKGPKGFAVIRPPGHHATRENPMGFCLFNNVAIAARYCQERHRLKKVSQASRRTCLLPKLQMLGIVREDAPRDISMGLHICSTPDWRGVQELGKGSENAMPAGYDTGL